MNQYNEFRHGDAVEQLQQLPNNSVHVIITSPPYWTQRDYGSGDQIGQEDTCEQYIDNIVSVARECRRILREDGSFLLNIGDTYISKERNLIPFRVAERLREDVGFLLRQDLIWEKEHPKPDPATDKRTPSHEYVFHFTNNRDYWYDETVCDGEHTSVLTEPTATSQLDHVAVYSEEFVREALRGIAPYSVCSVCETPYRRVYDRVPRPFTDPDRKQAKRAYELYEESDLNEEHIDAIQSVGISDVGKAIQTEDGAGRNADEVIELATEAKDVLGGYYREFTMVERVPDGFEPQCKCNGSSIGGIVCDPFVGSGTTAVVAEQLGLRYLGIDCNSEYLETARKRVGGFA